MKNNILIPVLLIAVVMVAGAFAFAPIDQASTVHGNISGELDDLGAVLCNIVSIGALAEYDGVNCTD